MSTNQKDARAALEEYCRNDAAMAIAASYADACWEATQDPFAFFYLPETDPTGAIAHDGTDAPEVAGSREAYLARENGPRGSGSYAEKLERLATMYGIGSPRRWTQVTMNPITGLPWTEEVAEGWRLRDAFEPTVRVVRGKETVGRLPRRGLDPRADAHHFRVDEPLDATTEWCGEDGVAREAPMAVCRDFVLTYEMFTPDNGWTYERVLDAGIIPEGLLGRLPGWWDSDRYRK